MIANLMLLEKILQKKSCLAKVKQSMKKGIPSTIGMPFLLINTGGLPFISVLLRLYNYH